MFTIIFFGVLEKVMRSNRIADGSSRLSPSPI